MARSVSKEVAAAPTGATAAPRALGFRPSPEARAAAYAMGADIAGLLAQLRLSLVEVKHAIEAIIASTPPGDPGLQSFMRRLCLFLGETYVFDPSGGG